jgi:hypothetical protein
MGALLCLTQASRLILVWQANCSFESVNAQLASDERSGNDRRASDRRAPRRPFDPMFAASLVNQIAPAETVYVSGYARTKPLARPGVLVSARA